GIRDFHVTGVQTCALPILPEGASQVRFWPLGLPRTLRPKLDEMFLGYRHLIISPFVTAEGLEAVVRPLPKGSEVTVISRAEELRSEERRVGKGGRCRGVSV